MGHGIGRKFKYGIVASLFKTKFGPIVFKGNLRENIIKVSKFGYDGIELAIRKLESVNLGKIEKLINKYNLEVIAFGTGQIYFDDGLSFLMIESVREKKLSRE